MNETWTALAREAELAASSIGIGATAVSRANYAQQAFYYQAFFSLSIGFERACKLILAVDHAVKNSGNFPPSRHWQVTYGHNLSKLLDSVAMLETGASEVIRPSSAIHAEIVDHLSEFANNLSRYYNLDVIGGSARAHEPVGRWYERIVRPIYENHVSSRQKRAIEQRAAAIGAIMGNFSMVRYVDESGDLIDGVSDASHRTGIWSASAPYARVYVLQLARFLGEHTRAVTYRAFHARLETVPHLHEFFGIFNNSDKYFRQRKVWELHGR